MGIFILMHPLSIAQKLKRFLPVVLLWIALSSVILFPFLEAIGLSTRTRMSTTETTFGIL